MGTKWGSTFVWIGRLLLSVLVAYVIANGLKTNTRFYKDPITPMLAGIFAGVLCFGMLYIISRKS